MTSTQKDLMYFKYYRKLDLYMLEAMANKLQKYKER